MFKENQAKRLKVEQAKQKELSLRDPKKKTPG
jgi:hypothetical protein